MARFSPLHEQPSRRHFEKVFDGIACNLTVLAPATERSTIGLPGGSMAASSASCKLDFGLGAKVLGPYCHAAGNLSAIREYDRE